jgi:hypothetical protein
MSNKSILEALAEVQRKVNEQRTKNAETNWGSVEESRILSPAERKASTDAGVARIQAARAAAADEAKKNADIKAAQIRIADRNNANPTPYDSENAKRQGIVARAADAVTGSPAPTAAAAPASAPAAAPKAPSTSGATMPSSVPGAGAKASGFGISGPTSSSGAVASAPKPPSAPAAAPKQVAKPAAPQAQSQPAPKPDFGYAQSGSDADTSANFFAADAARMRAQGGKAANDFSSETESGGKTKGKKMSESTLINAALSLIGKENMFVEAKKMKADCSKCGKSPCQCAGDPKKMEEEALDEKLIGNQKKLDKNHNNKLDSEDFKILRGKKMEEETEKLDEGGNPVNKVKKNAAVSAVGAKNRDDHYLDRMNPDVADKIRGREKLSGKDRQWNMEEAKKPKPDYLDMDNDGNKKESMKKAIKDKKIKDYRSDRDKHGEMEEEVTFSEEELAHIAAILEADAPAKAPVDGNKNYKVNAKGSERGVGDTTGDLTDEYNYIDEMARGVKAGTKRGSYKGKTHRGGMSKADASSEPAEEPKGVPHVLDQIRHGQEDEHGFKTITHPASSPEAPVSKSIHRSELHGFYDKYHNTEKPREKEKAYSDFLGKHFGDERATKETTKKVETDLSKVDKSTLKGAGPKVSLGGSKLVGGSK